MARGYKLQAVEWRLLGNVVLLDKWFIIFIARKRDKRGGEETHIRSESEGTAWVSRHSSAVSLQL